MSPRARRIVRRVFPFVLLVLLCGLASVALARPGGGQSYSGGSRSSGGGGYSGGGHSSGGDGGFLVQLIFWLVISHPAIGIPMLIVAALVFFGRAMFGSKLQEWSTAGSGAPAAQNRYDRERREWEEQQQALAQRPTHIPRAALDAIRTIDAEFSIALFEDFVYLLYAEIQRARASNPAHLAAFLSPQLAQTWRADPNLADVRGIVIGAMRVVAFSGVAGPAVSLELEFEANYVEAYRQGGERRFYVTDRMGLSRARTAVSRPAGRARTLDCPNCGAPLQNMRGTQCTYCQKDVGGGRFDWNVAYLSSVAKELRGPLLTSDVVEVGTEDPTIVDPQAVPRMRALEQRDPSFNWEAFTNRVGHVFRELQVAWSGRDPARIRPYVSDNLFQSMMYWIDLYVQSKCRNMNDNARILRLELANVLTDKVYDSVTIRVFASGFDYTISDDGRVLSGSRKRERTYSEYYTFIRGTQRTGPARSDQNCPNCGAPLDISMVGNCRHCSAKVTAGEFDWVLSRIEQDESYSG